MSWRITLLPHFGQQKLFDTYDQAESWSAGVNRPLLRKRPAEYHCPASPETKGETSRTSYVAVTGPDSVFSAGQATTIQDVSDGMSQTLMFVERHHERPEWTEPRDLPIDWVPAFAGADEEGRLHTPPVSRALGSSLHLGGSQAVFVDGSVRFFSQDTDQAVIKALATIARGEAIDEF